MRTRSRFILALSPLLLWGCPSYVMGMRPLTTATTPTFVVIVSSSDYDYPVVKTLSHARYRVRSGSDILWQVDASLPCPGGWSDSIELRYGETPPCFRSVVAARPLVEGRAYVVEGFRNFRQTPADVLSDVRLIFVLRDGKVDPIDAQLYAASTGDSSLLPVSR